MPLSAEERLIPVRVKIKRAKKHLAELEAAAETYRDSYTHVAVTEENPKFAQGEPNLRKLPIIHFDMLAIAGDVLQNLRSALDHVMYNLALVADPNASDTVLGEISFPIGKSLESYKSLAGRKVERLVEPRAMEFINKLQPYRGGNDALWRLHETNNIDKHRRLIAIGTDILCDGDGFDGYYWLKDDNPPFESVDLSERDKNAEITGFKSLIHLEAAKREALIPTLHQLTEFVETLIETFKPYLVKG